MPPLWTVEFSQRAAADFDEIILHTFKYFGQHQAQRYSELIAHSVRELSESGPDHYLAKTRPELHADIQSMPIRRVGMNAKHLLFFKEVVDKQSRKIVILRILHTSMDFEEHL
ncbi:type II toxin-antitoxin system RelE/ParE family toxin [Marinobacter sp.]|uniref:type II toxin-antitoxin system RelE/ParE family toxin n=1 Tax=Marinobacter sp. TaxID=50741 RepID=UPI003A8D172B